MEKPNKYEEEEGRQYSLTEKNEKKEKRRIKRTRILNVHVEEEKAMLVTGRNSPVRFRGGKCTGL